MACRFVVLTTQRSGSTWLMSLLNSFENVTSQGELFLQRTRSEQRRWDSDFAMPRFVETQTGRRWRPFATWAYLNDLYSKPGTVGFKLMYSQLRSYSEIWAYLMCRRIRVVHLVRRNYLDVLISSALKAKLGQAHFLAGQPRPDDPRVEIETQGLIDCLKWKEQKYKSMRNLLRWSALPHLEVAYEDLVRDQSHFDAIWSFLSIDPQGHRAESQIKKTRQQGQLDTITNFAEVQRALAGTRYAGLVESGS